MANAMTAVNLAFAAALGLLVAAPVHAESPLSSSAEVTPDTIYHRGGYQRPVIAQELKPFEIDPVATHYSCIPPVNTQVSEFTTLAPVSRIDPDVLISKGGRSF